MDEQGNIIIYQSEDGVVRLDVRLADNTVWLTQQQMADLYSSSRTNVVEHIKHIYEEGELEEDATCRKFRQVRQEGNREVAREIPYYNLDMIISLGYRVRTITATRFRQWATERLHEYIVKGFTLDDERLKNLGGGSYWKELLDRIRDIRSSEKVLYRQVLDLYATAVDYDPRSDTSRLFFKIVQNKLHYAAHRHTAAEVIYERADADKPFMGLTTFRGGMPSPTENLLTCFVWLWSACLSLPEPTAASSRWHVPLPTSMAVSRCNFPILQPPWATAIWTVAIGLKEAYNQ